MKRKGFTLIELIAVIVILGLIMLIAVPSVSGQIITARKGAYSNDIKAYMETVLGEYESKNYGYYLEDTELLLVPISRVKIEKGGAKQSPFGKYVQNDSYIVIQKSRTSHESYAYIRDTSGYGVSGKAYEEVNRNIIDKQPSDSITGLQSYYQCDNGRTVLNRDVPYFFQGDEYHACKEEAIIDCTSTTIPIIRMCSSSNICHINYNLDGGHLEVPNPTEYNDSTRDIILNEPVKDGYDFIGWTGSNGNYPEHNVRIGAETSCQKSYKANWQEQPTVITPTIYTITYQGDFARCSNQSKNGGMDWDNLCDPTCITSWRDMSTGIDYTPSTSPGKAVKNLTLTPVVNAHTIQECAPMYYGKKVTYSKLNSAYTWSMYLSDNTYTYVITDSKIDVSNVPVPSGVTRYKSGTCYFFGKKYNSDDKNNSSDASQSGDVVKYYKNKFTDFYKNTNKIVFDKFLSKYKNQCVQSNTLKSDCTGEKGYNHVQATMSLLDTGVWSTFNSGGKIYYTIGSPTVEMFEQSVNDKLSISLNFKVNNHGYTLNGENLCGSGTTISASISNESLYFPSGNSYWFASPAGQGQHKCMIHASGTNNIWGRRFNNYYSDPCFGLRPVNAMASGTYYKTDNSRKLAVID